MLKFIKYAAIAAVIAVFALVLLDMRSERIGDSSLPAAQKHPAASRAGMTIDPTADIHPSVILEGTITVGAYTKIDAGTILTGNITIGHHTLIRCNSTLRGRIRIGNYTHIYDNVNIEGGRPAKPVGGSLAEVADQAVIGDHCWINHGAVMHGTQIADSGSVGLGTAYDYNTHIGKNAVLADGSATRVNMEICDGCFFEGVPAVRKKKGLTEKDRAEYFGVSPLAWTTYEGGRQEVNAKRRMGK